MNGYHIKPVRGHYEVYNKNGKFIMSVDTYEEAIFEIGTVLPKQ